jgi:amino acid adenylation domain-containing protein/thioester reductase-like protein
MFNLIRVKKQEFTSNICQERQLANGILDKYISSVWFSLLNRYENYAEKMTVFYFDNDKLMSFSCNSGSDKSQSNFMSSYNSNKNFASETLSSAMSSSSDIICLLSMEQLLTLPIKDKKNLKLSLHISKDSVDFIFNNSYFNQTTSKWLIDRLGVLVESLIEKKAPPYSASVEHEELKYIERFHTPAVIDSKTSADLVKGVENLALANPNKIALCESDSEMTYQKFVANYQKVANQLIQKGITVGDRVGLCMQNRASFVMSMFAVLKAGASFVPLDTAMPKSRIEFIVNDANLKLILLDDTRDSDLFNRPTVTFSELITDNSLVSENFDIQPDKHTEAYVIYTSGSTGKPKGVCISRESLTFYASTAINMYEITAQDRALQFSSIIFDAMIEEIFPTLLAGATLVIRSSLHSNNLSTILDYIQEKQVTVLNFPTLYWKGLNRYKNLAEALSSNVRLVIIGGESVSLKDLENWQANFANGPKLVNTYGPTETTVVTTIYYVPEDIHQINCNIGRPIPGSKVYLVDKNGEVAPVGGVGEICIGGPGLATGYINRDFNESLLELSSQGGALGSFYKSGDYGRYLHDGNIEFLGRKDEQVKVSGYRVNLDEIKVQILNFDSDISDIKVLSIKTKNEKTNKIIAFVESTVVNDKSKLFEYLKGQLPSYMLPYILFLEEFPRLVNGKTDLKSLENLYFDEIEYEFNSEQSDTENQIAKIWKEILQTQIIDADKSFVDYGGNSIDTINMLNRVNTAFNLETPHRNYLQKKLSVKNIANDISHQLDSILGSQVQIKDKYCSISFDEWRDEEAVLNHQTLNNSFTGNGNKDSYSVVLSGACGFLGIHMLHDLLIKENVNHIYCLIRSAPGQDIGSRVIEAANRNQLDIDVCSEKLTLIESDITQKRFGLYEQEYAHLANSVCSIIHCAATVNMQLDYESLKETNVESTRKLIEFALFGLKKHIHYISSIAIFDCSPRLNSVDEYTSLDKVTSLPSGYAQSKWVSEKMILNARILGVDTSVYRCGRIWGNLHSGNMPNNDLIWKFITGCIDVGYAPDIDMEMDITPACFMSKSIIALAFSDTSNAERYFNLANPNITKLTEIYSFLNYKDNPLKIINYRSWLDEVVKRKFKEDPTHPLSSFEFVAHDDDHNSWVDTYFRGKRTENSLKSLNLNYPPITSAVLSTYLET